MKSQICKSHACKPGSKSSWLLLGATVAIGAAFVSGCAVSIPSGIQPVTNFDVNKYLGKWYELARIDHHFERGLSNTTAEYSLNDDGTVKVINRGYSVDKDIWKESAGKAKFLKDPKTAALKVSFFGPLYGGYNVVYLDESYQTALIIGDNVKYFWLLSRDLSISDERYDGLLKKAKGMGVDVSQVIRVTQTP